MGKTNKVKYGLKNVYYAKATIDDDGEITYDVPVHIPGAVNLSLDAEGETEPWYADNMAYVTLNNNSGYSGDLEIALIPGSFYEDILHEERNEDNLLLENTNVDFEHFALMFQFQGDKKAIRHVLYNCTCSRPSIESSTTEDTKEPQTDTFSFTAHPIKSGYVKAKTSAATPDEIYNAWFDAVYIPGQSPIERTYTVCFFDGDTLLETVTDVPYGSAATYSGEEPSKTGYTFTGWDPDPSYVISDMVCYAQFEEIDMVAFAVLDETDGSLVFYSDEDVPEVGSTYKDQTVSKVYTGVEDTGTSYNSAPWYDDRESIKVVKFDESFATVRINTICYWFYRFANLTSINLNNLNTSKVTDMTSMFYGCSGLTTLDLTPLDTSAVTNMTSMFYGCSGLTTLDLTPLDTGAVTNMMCMFYSCSGLTTLDLTSLDTGAVTNMTGMFYGCSGLTTLDLTALDTSAVTTMEGMFNGCSGLTTLDLTSLDTSAVTNMTSMFYRCSRLVTIYSDDSKFKTDKVTSGNAMFMYCYMLAGGAGTVYNSSKVTHEMAHVDTEDNPGYFTAKE